MASWRTGSPHGVSRDRGEMEHRRTMASECARAHPVDGNRPARTDLAVALARLRLRTLRSTLRVHEEGAYCRCRASRGRRTVVVANHAGRATPVASAAGTGS